MQMVSEHVKERCSDCCYLGAGENDEWLCDGVPCESVPDGDCPVMNPDDDGMIEMTCPFCGGKAFVRSDPS